MTRWDALGGELVGAASDADLACAAFDELAEEIATRCRRGDFPSIDEYVARYPDDRDTVRYLLEAVVLIERSKRRDLTPATGLRPSESVSFALSANSVGAGWESFSRRCRSRLGERSP